MVGVLNYNFTIRYWFITLKSKISRRVTKHVVLHTRLPHKCRLKHPSGAFISHCASENYDCIWNNAYTFFESCPTQQSPKQIIT